MGGAGGIATTAGAARLAAKLVVVCMIAVLLIALLGGMRESGGRPDPSVLAREQQRSVEAGSLAYEEEQREQRYREEPGPPAPVRGWEP